MESKDPRQSKDGYNRWHERMPEQTWSFPYRNLEEMGFVYIYLMDGDDPVSFYKI